MHGELRLNLLIVGFFTPAIDGFIILFMTALVLARLKEQEARLSLSELNFQVAEEYAGMGHWELSADGKTAVWSEQMYHLLGLSFNTSPGPETLRKLVHDEDYAAFIKSVRYSFETKNEHHVEYRIRRESDGEERWMESRGSVSCDEDGRPEKISGVLHDITESKLRKLALVRSEEKYRTLIDASPYCIHQIDAEGSLISMNKSGLQMISVDNEASIVGIPYLSSVSEQDREQVSKLLADALNGKYNEFEFYSTDGKYFHSNFVPIRGESGKVDRVLGITQDFTERKQAEEKLLLSSRVFSDTHEGITITDANMSILDVNPAFCEITGYSRKEVLGKNPKMLSSGKQSPEFFEEMWQQIQDNGHWQGEVWNRKKSGEIYAELLTISVLKDDNDNIVNYVGVFTDITSSKRQQEQLSLMAHYDVLTGLPNRALFTDRFAQAIAHSKRTDHQLAVCFIDLDDFKQVNDNYGHEVGDQLLVEVAERITSCIRQEDTVSRQGGDEFALLLNDLEFLSQWEQTLERIHNSLAQPYIINDHPHKITASSGVTLYPNDNGDIDTLLRHADQAMYQAKLAGKHRYYLFNPERDQLTILKHNQLEEIELALANNEFQLFYQPKVNMVTGEVFGAEALIRWFNPEKGLIPPLDFLPILEGTELELKVGNWVINEALAQLETWKQQGIKLEVSVNISSHHLLSETFFSELDNALAKYPSADSQCFQLEILESSALGDLNVIRSIIEACQVTLGIKVALDDFGTGYSSLTHLRNIPADIIKIDQSFVRDMLDDPSDYTIIDGIIGLSASFNREVIAEGVESTEHGLMLLMMGCENAQGYSIAKPMPADDIADWLVNYTPNQQWLLFGNKHCSVKENSMRLFKLIRDHWMKVFISNINSPPKTITHWPDFQGHCEQWLNREKQGTSFDKEVLQRLEQALNDFNFLAQSLQQKYQDGEIESARDDLNQLQVAFDEMTRVELV